METLVVNPQNPKKPKRQDDDPPDKGGSSAAPTPSFGQPTKKIIAPNASYKDMLMGESNEDPMMDIYFSYKRHPAIASFLYRQPHPLRPHRHDPSLGNRICS
ncbi:hypothetical protein V6N11_020302 [Hibiscus sabdariffa]|uniref:Uncharacterized protein n=1 Tax=Hibiscus sabdariffa TaxID=183260 RepID=A0ABR2Q836_9ROSI